MHICVACGFENPEGHKFCGSCGSRLGPTAPGRCRECGSPAGIRDHFCIYCGAALPEVGGGWDPATLAQLAQGSPSPEADEPPSEPEGGEVLETETVEPSGDHPTAAMRAPVRLRVVAGRNLDEVHILPADGGTIGRDPDSDLVLETDAYVNDCHCTISRTEKGIVVEDLASVNGIFLRLRETRVLKAGDEIKIGQSIFRVEK